MIEIWPERRRDDRQRDKDVTGKDVPPPSRIGFATALSLAVKPASPSPASQTGDISDRPITYIAYGISPRTPKQNPALPTLPALRVHMRLPRIQAAIYAAFI